MRGDLCVRRLHRDFLSEFLSVPASFDIDEVIINVCTDANVTFTSLASRYPPRLGCRTSTPPPRACLRLSSHGQPGPVCSPPVLPPADHVGLPVWSRSAQRAALFVSGCGLIFLSLIVFFVPQSRYSVVRRATLCSDQKSCAARMCFVLFYFNSINAVSQTVHWPQNRGRHNPCLALRVEKRKRGEKENELLKKRNESNNIKH